MQKMIKKVSGCIFLLFVFLVQAGALDMNVLKKMLLHPRLKGDFMLERVMADLPMPLIFSGNFELKNKELTIWVKTPMPMNFKVNAKGIYAKVQEGYVPLLEANFDPVLFDAALAVDFNKLGSYFFITQSGDEKYWMLTLRAKKRNTGVEVIQIDGSQFIQTIYVKEDSGSNTLRLSNIRTK